MQSARVTAPVVPVIESLEARALLSGVGAVGADLAGDNVAAIVMPRAAKVKVPGTKTTMTVSAGTLGQPITFTITVRAAAAAGAPTGTINLVQGHSVVQSVTLAPATSTNPKYAISQGTYTLTPQTGGPAFFIGKHPLGAVYVPSGEFKASKTNIKFSVPKPTYTALANGVKYETIAAGSGVGLADGQTASMLYTGYLAKNGKIFDDSVNHETNGMVSAFQFIVGEGQVIAGFDEASVGMEVGESRLVLIPPAEGYGKKASGSIPGNSTLIFEITLESIS